MIKIINNPESVSSKELAKVLKKDGIFMTNSYLNSSIISEVKNEVLDCHDKYGSNYNFGSVYSIKSPYSLMGCNKQVNLFEDKWIKNLFLLINNNMEGFNTSIYSTHDYIFNKQDLARNGCLHFDRNRSLKFFIYLTDVNKHNGAFYIEPQTHDLGTKLREIAWGGNSPKPTDNLFKKAYNKFFGKKFKDVKNRIEIDYPEYYNPKNLIPVEGKAGTLIVFDSDLFHKGGVIQKSNLSRLVLRMHSYLSS